MAESIRVLHLVRAGAVKARTACLNELQALLVTAPTELREQLAGLKDPARRRLLPVEAFRGSDRPRSERQGALRHLAARYRTLSAEIDAAYNQLKGLIEQARPGMLAVQGVNRPGFGGDLIS
ncbi:hypothetical protein FE391_40490 [Nonomuraea sp. KC401]|uniref:hypothetical protein n=1 Tax=unclassified Nonomuraea TaxID=2593643 RepID=UPI0010FF55D1|nr:MULTISPECIES: hypothetical protein [unclassified Nonomuraea]NBE93038.1 hypothetical protein [Nonomuraea sp. K271]TLF55629.1 hypothetical protein FE391_40490 [Nonomuraea sp. KC401]